MTKTKGFGNFNEWETITEAGTATPSPLRTDINATNKYLEISID